MKPTDVLLTVDLEFSSGGYLDDPERYQPIGEHSVELRIDGKSQGLGFILDTLGHYGAVGTFFVEAAHTLYFGPEPMGKFVRQILDGGHDVQLHLHPQWIFAEQIKSGTLTDLSSVTDSMVALQEDRICALIDVGLQAFKSWGVPEPVAMRAGNLHANACVYRAMSEKGLALGSNIGIGVYRPAEDALQLYSGRHRIEKVLEIPVLSHRGLGIGGSARLKTLTITGSSAAETRFLLDRARRAGLDEVVLLTHAHEMIKRIDARYLSISRNRLTQRRLHALCQYVTGNPDKFRFSTFAGKCDQWLGSPDTDNHVLDVPNRLAALGMAQNVINDLIRPS